MKKLRTVIVIFILILPIIVFGIPDYIELNDLAIIRGVGVSCSENVDLYFQEIIPMKGENGINYQYDYYQADGNSLEDAFDTLQLKAKKKLYLEKIKFLVTDCTKSDMVFDNFKLDDIKIYHVQDHVLEKLKKVKQ